VSGVEGEGPPRDGRRLRWGVLSTANIGRAAVNPAIQASDNGELLAVGSREPERARAFAERHGIPVHHGSYEALLDDERVEAVYIPLPNALHLEWTVRAARAGKHVLCEKPLALDAAQCREMAAAAGEHGVLLMEAFMYRFHPRTERVIAMVRAGALGPPRIIRSAFTFRLSRYEDIRWSKELGGGALMDVGCYCVDITRRLAGAQPVEVQAAATWTERDVDSETAGLLRFDEGLVAHFDCALTLERCEFYEVAGPQAWLRVQSAFLPGTAPVSFEVHRGRSEVVEHKVDGADEYRLMVEHFADAVLGGVPLRYPPAEAARNMEVIAALQASARAGGRSVRTTP
jgi:xylose dehydrogenase (NAD/NADP)